MTDTALLRGLDDRGRAAVVAAAQSRQLRAGDVVYREGDVADAVLIITSGQIELRATRRGDERATVVRTAGIGSVIGDEAIVPGLPRRTQAVATTAVTVDEIPIAVLSRALAWSGARGEREIRYAERAAARDLLVQTAIGRDLNATDLEILLDGIRVERVARATRLYETGDRAGPAYAVIDGLVQLVRDSDDKPAVVAYLARGDLFGDEVASGDDTRATTAVAAGDSWCAVIAPAAIRTLADRNPGLFTGLRRVIHDRAASTAALVGAAAARSTQHVFHDLYRMQMARSLLVIDQDACVRCGHCAASCADTHDGVSRLLRRGDKIVTPMASSAATLLLPNTCQQCRNAACMIDCPTGAIGRDPDGEVFIRPELCTGCGNCVRACPWDNVQLAVRPPTVPGAAPAIAVKCDLCRGFAAPACVEACPTSALVRLDPRRAFAEVAAVLGDVTAITTSKKPRSDRGVGTVAIVVAMMLSLAAAIRVAAGVSAGGRVLAGVGAGLAIIGLAGHVFIKRGRSPVVRMGRRDADLPAPRSRTRVPLLIHVALGVLTPAAVWIHTRGHVPSTPAGVLMMAFFIASAAGLFGAVAYRLVPRALTRLERAGDLPEDLPAVAEQLRVTLVRELSGADVLVQRVAERVLVPYSQSRFGWLSLVASGRSLGDERRRLRADIDRGLDGRGGDRLAGLDRAIEQVVDLRALPGRRILTAALTAWLPLHAIAAATLVALLVLHVIAVFAW